MADSIDISRIPRFKRGDILLHDQVNGIVDSLKRDFEVRGPGVRQDGRRVQILATSSQSSTVSIAIPDSPILAASGFNSGIGTATIWKYNEDTGAIETTGESIDVINPARTTSSVTAAIRGGQICLVFTDQYGASIIVPIEC